MRRPRGEQVAVAAGLLLATVAAVVLLTRDAFSERFPSLGGRVYQTVD